MDNKKNELLDQIKLRFSEENYKILKELFNTGKLTTKDILQLDPLELECLTNLDKSSVEILMEDCMNIMLIGKICKTNTLKESFKISSFCRQLDYSIGGGFYANSLYELVGFAGSGKTQICLMLSLTTQLKKHMGLHLGVVYICTEGSFPITRFKQLETHMQTKYKYNFCDNLYLQHLNDFESLRKCLFRQVPFLIKRHPIGLLIIDSIAGIYRGEEINYIVRSQQLTTIAVKLKDLSYKHNIVTVCTNQVTENIEKGQIQPCLGLTWSNLVTNRFFISRTTTPAERELSVIFSTYVDPTKCKFYIQESGLKDSTN